MVKTCIEEKIVSTDGQAWAHRIHMHSRLLLQVKLERGALQPPEHTKGAGVANVQLYNYYG
jgi:hypothetical protein